MPISIKDIDAVIRKLEHEGHQLEELEALLLHSDDFFELMRFIHKNSDNITSKCSGIDMYCSSDAIRMFGVKIIASQNIPLGSIFKIFKNEAPYKPPPQSFVRTIPESESFLPLPTMGHPNAGLLNGHWCDAPPSDMALDEKPKKEKKKGKKRTRRVELD